MNRKKEIIGLIIIFFSILFSISIALYDNTKIPGGTFNIDLGVWPFGIFQIYISHFFHSYILGYFSIFLFLIFFMLGLSLFTNFKVKFNLITYFNFLFASILLSISTSFLFGFHSGYLSFSLYTFVNDIFGNIGFILIILLSFAILLSNIFKFSIYEFFNLFYNFIKDFFYKIKNKFQNRKKSIFDQVIDEESASDNIHEKINESSIVLEDNYEKEQEDSINDTKEESDNKNLDNTIKSNIEEDNKSKKKDEEENDLIVEDETEVDQGNFEKQNKNKLFTYKLPKLDFLNEEVEISNHDEDSLREKARYLVDSLSSFGVSGTVVKISPGPVVTLYEIEPAEGVRVNKFTNLSEDLSRIMGGKRVRIIAPIPGSKSVGIELPNESPAIVYLKSIVNSKLFLDNESKLKIALGKTTTGDAFVFELDKMPHLLVAGATGAGKSVCINTIIISILYNAKPNEVKFILMDPKKVELSTYKSLVGYHLITASNLDEYVMTTSENAVAILDSAINEMEKRFEIFSNARVRNIKEYHQKMMSDNSLSEVPYIVVVIDELADLMMTSGRAIEEPITRLAQKARAVGIHLIVATQRPSVDVITGLIKSNFPARISFQVSSRVDSRTIIDQIGAEKLLGRGDMLFLLPGTAAPIRLHNAFITLEEIEKIMNHIMSQSKPDEMKLPEVKKVNLEGDFEVNKNSDELLYDAAKLVLDHQQASVSLLQRKFRIGYSRAGRLIDELESLGIITGHSGSKAREVLVDYSYIEEIFND